MPSAVLRYKIACLGRDGQWGVAMRLDSLLWVVLLQGRVAEPGSPDPSPLFVVVVVVVA